MEAATAAGVGRGRARSTVRRRCARPSRSRPPTTPTWSPCGRPAGRSRSPSPSTPTRVRSIAAGLAALGVRARRHGRDHAAEPARVQPLRRGGDAPRGDAVLDLQHLVARADRLPVRQRRQPGRDHRDAVPRPRSRPPGSTGSSTIVCVDGAPEGTIGLDELEAAATRRLRLRGGLARGRARRPDHPLLHVGHHRAAEGRAAHPRQPHRRGRAASRRDRTTRPGDRTVSYLPHAHMADRFTGHYGPMAYAETVTVVADPREVVAALPDARPTVWVAVPRIWEKIKAALEAQGVTDPARCRDEARGGGAREARPRPGPGRVRRRGADPDRGARVLRGLGLPIREVWGMSELTCVATVQPAGRRASSARSASRSRASSEARRRRRAARPRPDPDGGLPPRPGEDRRGDRRRRLDAHRRHRRDRRRRLRDDRRPQEGADHQRRRQEHVAGEHRGAAEDLEPADRPGDAASATAGPTTSR